MVLTIFLRTLLYSLTLLINRSEYPKAMGSMHISVNKLRFQSSFSFRLQSGRFVLRC